MRQGRPTSPSSKKGRTHAALLTVKAELLLRAVKGKRPEFNFSKYVTEHVIRDFGSNTAEVNALRMELVELNKETAQKEVRIQLVMERIRVVKVRQSELEAAQVDDRFGR